MTFERFYLHKPDKIPEPVAAIPASIQNIFRRILAPTQLPSYWIERRHLQVFGAQLSGAGELGLYSGEGPKSSMLLPDESVKRCLLPGDY